MKSKANRVEALDPQIKRQLMRIVKHLSHDAAHALELCMTTSGTIAMWNGLDSNFHKEARIEALLKTLLRDFDGTADDDIATLHALEKRFVACAAMVSNRRFELYMNSTPRAMNA